MGKKKQFGFILARRILFLTMQFVLSLFLILGSAQSSSQIFLNKEREQTENDWVFNAEFIRSHKIKSINGRFSYKPKGLPMRETHFWQIFEFDTLGRIQRSYETRQDDGTKDTVWFNYFYNDKGLLIYQSREHGEFLSYTSTIYDQEKRVIAVEKFERKPDGIGIPVVKEKMKEKYDWQLTDSTHTKMKKNGYGTPVSKETNFFDEKGNLIRTEDRYISTNEGLIYLFDYDENGNLLTKKTLTSKQKREKELLTFVYDKSGNLTEKKYFEEGKIKRETQLIYNEESQLPSSILVMEGESSNISILRIKEYEYY